MEFKKAGLAFYCLGGRILKITSTCTLCKYYSFCGDQTSIFIKHNFDTKRFSHVMEAIPKKQEKMKL